MPPSPRRSRRSATSIRTSGGGPASPRSRGASRGSRSSIVNFVGQSVKAGDPLAELYSPELYSATQELLTAQRFAQRAAAPKTALGRSVMDDPQDLVRLASEKLRLWGLTQAQIDRILQEGKADHRMLITAPIGGVVSEQFVVQGQYVEEGGDMFERRRPGPRLDQGAGLCRPGRAGAGRAGGRGDRGVVPGRDLPGDRRVHRPEARPRDPDGRRALRPGEPRAAAPPGDVRHGEPQDPRGGDARSSGRGSPRRRRRPASTRAWPSRRSAR